MKPRYLAKIDKWYQQPMGVWVLEQERALLKQLWPSNLGHYLLQLGLSSKVSVLPTDIKMHSCLSLTPFMHSPSSIVGDLTLLPIANDSMDVVLVHHWLGIWGDPIQALQEIYRVLVPEGRIIICGLRPSWIWQMYDAFHQESQFPWSLRSASIWQVKNWLEETGFVLEILRLHSQGLSLYRYSEHSPQSWLKFSKLPFGSGYIFVAQKRVANLTPIKLEWAMRTEMANYSDTRAAQPFKRQAGRIDKET
ncbi:MAG: class I SAM-dependent methyltransferase [Gammaproteobacteria bacterium]